MFQVLLAFTIAIGVGLGAGPGGSPMAAQGDMTESVSLLDGTSNGAPATDETDENASLLDGTDSETTPATSGWQPEPQIPTGKFTTATEVKPILTATKSAWIALREYDGNDLLYFSQLASWRCGLHEVRFGINGAAEQVFELEECHIDTAQPNALTMETHLPYIVYGLGSVDSVTITLTFDDGSTDTASYMRKDILMP